ncbi:MAG TPA: hypothetical protein VFL97_07905 [Nitrococcus sp.]|nr:hypothetical protein [Nitrococcus sp.]
MVGGERILVPVEDPKVMRRVIDYVGAMIAGRDHVVVHLFHRLPSLPPQLREHGGSEDSERERLLREELERDIYRWVSEQQNKCRLVLNEAHERLIGAGVPGDAVRMKIGKAAFADEELGEALRRTAWELDCRTIALSREQAPALRNIFRNRPRDRVKDAAFVIWMVG